MFVQETGKPHTDKERKTEPLVIGSVEIDVGGRIVANAKTLAILQARTLITARIPGQARKIHSFYT